MVFTSPPLARFCARPANPKTPVVLVKIRQAAILDLTLLCLRLKKVGDILSNH
jgi:hypothetical protein